MERLVRQWTQMTPVDVQTLADTTPPERYSKGGMYAEGPWNSPETEVLIGREFKASFPSGERFTFRFTGKNAVVWTENGGEEHEDFCQAHLCPGYDMIYFVNMFCHGSKPPRALTFVIDDERGLITLVDAHIGVPWSAIDVGRTFHFGRIDGSGEEYPLHSFTTDMIGKAIIWDYGPQAPNVKHIYTMPMYYTYIMMRDDACWVASNPADYVKIRDGLYLFGFIEERQSGLQSLFLMNLDLLHDVGAFFGVNIRGLSCKTLGAKGTLSDMYTKFDR